MCVRVFVCNCTILDMQVCMFVRMWECTYMYNIKMAKAGGTPRSSRAAPHPGTNQALRYSCALLRHLHGYIVCACMALTCCGYTWQSVVSNNGPLGYEPNTLPLNVTKNEYGSTYSWGR